MSHFLLWFGCDDETPTLYVGTRDEAETRIRIVRGSAFTESERKLTPGRILDVDRCFALGVVREVAEKP